MEANIEILRSNYVYIQILRSIGQNYIFFEKFVFRNFQFNSKTLTQPRCKHNLL